MHYSNNGVGYGIPNSDIIGHIINVFVALAPLCLRGVTRRGVIYMLMVLVILPPQVYFVHITIISLTCPNNLLPVNPLVVGSMGDAEID